MGSGQNPVRVKGDNTPETTAAGERVTHRRIQVSGVNRAQHDSVNIGGKYQIQQEAAYCRSHCITLVHSQELYRQALAG
jgi:hypothetical protein